MVGQTKHRDQKQNEKEIGFGFGINSGAIELEAHPIALNCITSSVLRIARPVSTTIYDSLLLENC